MRKAKWLVASLVLLGGMAYVAAQGDKTPTVEQIMEKAHKQKTGLRDKITTETKKDKPDWDNVKKMTSEFVDLANALEKNKPPKGDEKSWQKLSKEYAGQVKTLDDAAGKKDKAAVDKANKTLGANCKGCHDAHQP